MILVNTIPTENNLGHFRDGNQLGVDWSEGRQEQSCPGNNFLCGSYYDDSYTPPISYLGLPLTFFCFSTSLLLHTSNLKFTSYNLLD